MLINVGLVGPKARTKVVVDGQQVNIPALLCVRSKQNMMHVYCLRMKYVLTVALPKEGHGMIV